MMFGRKKEPEKPIDKTPWDRIRVLTATGEVAKFNKNTSYYEVSGDTLYIYGAAKANIIAIYPRFSGVSYINVYWELLYAAY